MKYIQNMLLFAKKSLKKLILVWPMQSFFGLLAVLLVLIVVGNYLRKPPVVEKEKKKQLKEVEIYSVGKAPRITIQAKVEKSGIIKLVSLSGGIVQKIYKTEGDQVKKGDWLFWLSSNYQGAVAASLSRSIAEKNLKFIKDTYDTQKEIISKNREVASNMESQSADLRDIGSKSIDEAKSLISLNENVISMLDAQIKALEAINVNGASDSAILQLKTGKASALAGLNQAKAALRSTEYQTNGENEPAKLAQLQRDITLKQLEVQEKSLGLNKEVAYLNFRLSQIQESLMYPASPVSGVVERIHVKVGQSVGPGTLLATITGSSTTANAVVFTSAQIAQNVSRFEMSTLRFSDTTISLYPAYISSQPTEGNMYSILFVLPEGFTSQVSNEEIINIDLPIGSPSTNSFIPYIPLDAIYQTKDEAYIYVIQKNRNEKKVVGRKVTLGPVYGSYVEVIKGLRDADLIVLDRNVVEGEQVTVHFK